MADPTASSLELEEWCEQNRIPQDAAEAYFDNYHVALADAELSDYDRLIDAYVGHFETLADFTFELVHGSGLLDEVPAWAVRHIDFGSLGRDFMIGDYFEVDGHYFRAHV